MDSLGKHRGDPHLSPPRTGQHLLHQAMPKDTRQSLTPGVSVGEAVSVCEAPAHHQR